MFEKKYKGTTQDGVTKNNDTLKLLVLDDLLISLDMSFRMKLINYIQEQQKPDGSFEGYQIILLTHDKGLFEILKDNLAKDEKKWKWFECFENNTYPISTNEYKNPLFITNKDYLTIAKEYLEGKKFEQKTNEWIVIPKNYELCALYLRKKVEQILLRFYDPEIEQIFRLKILQTVEHGSLGVNKEFLEKQLRIFDNILELQRPDQERLLNLASLSLPIPVDTPDEEKPMIGQANRFHQKVYKFLSEYFKDYTAKKEEREKLLQLSQDLLSVKNSILNPATHHDGALTI